MNIVSIIKYILNYLFRCYCYFFQGWIVFCYGVVQFIVIGIGKRGKIVFVIRQREVKCFFEVRVVFVWLFQDSGQGSVNCIVVGKVGKVSFNFIFVYILGVVLVGIGIGIDGVIVR